MILLSMVFIVETFHPEGILSRRLRSTMLGLIILCTMIGAFTPLAVKVMRASWFLLPGVVGIAFLRKEDA